jgi:hypothetical protein
MREVDGQLVMHMLGSTRKTMRAFIYWNLHKNVYSVKNTRTGLVAAHAEQVVVKDAEFVVSEAGRARVLRERSKNVHAGVRGTVEVSEEVLNLRGWSRVTYNPYKYDSFVRASDERPLEGAEEVRMVIRGGKARVYAKGLRFRETAAQAA